MRVKKINPKLFIGLWVLFMFLLFFTMMTNVGEGEVPGWEFNISRNLNDYIHREKKTATIMPKDFCDNPSFLVIICISSPTGFEARRVIRSSWGMDRTVMGHNVSLYFLIGQTTDLEIQKRITAESLEFEDIVQENCYDSYNNLTIKSAMMLKLFTQRCQSTAKYLLKIDDDSYLNVPKLVDDLLTRNRTQNLLMGNAICGSKPIRNYGDKWYAGPKYLFPDEDYPNYLSGSGYCMSKDVATKLLDAAMTTPVFHLEDVYLTGMCATKIGQELTHNGRFTFHYIKPDYCLFKDLIVAHYQSPENIRKIYEALKNPEIQKQCQREENVFMVHKWLMDHVFTVSKPKRRKSCP